METVTITMKNPPALYLEADNVSPDVFAGKTAAQIAELHVHEGNTTSTLGKYFEVSGNAGATAADTKIIVKGDVKKVKYIGFKMTAGELAMMTNAQGWNAARCRLTRECRCVAGPCGQAPARAREQPLDRSAKHPALLIVVQGLPGDELLDGPCGVKHVPEICGVRLLRQHRESRGC